MINLTNRQENEDSFLSNSHKKCRTLTKIEELSNSYNSKSKILKDLNQSYVDIPEKKYQSKKNLDKKFVSIDNNALSRLNLKKTFYNFKENILSSTNLTKSQNSLSMKSLEKIIQQKIFNISMKIEEEEESTIIKGEQKNNNLKLTNLIKKKIVDKDNLSIFSPKHNKKVQNSPKNYFFENNKEKETISLSKKSTHKLKVIKTLKNNKNKFRILLKKNLIYDSFDSGEEEELEGIIIPPDNSFILFIDLLIIISSLFNMIYTPFYISNIISFYSTTKSCRYIYYFIDLLYIIDLILGFFRAHHNYQFQIIKKNVEIIKHYLFTQFFLDLIQAIPFFSYIFFLQDNNKIRYFEYYDIKSFHLLLILCCNLKYLKFFKVIDIKKNSVFYKIKQSISNNDHHEKIFTFLIYFILCIFGFYFFISIHILIGRSSYPNWIIKFGFQNESLLSLYLISFYYIITTTTTVGYGNIVCASSFRELMFQIILLSVGITVYSWIVSNIGNYVKNESSASIRFDKDEAILEEIRILYPNISYSLYKKIFNHLGVRKIRQRQCDSNILINSLPHSLKTEILLSIHKKTINNFKIFRGNQNSDFTVRILTNFIPLFSKKNAFLIHEGQLINNIIFVKEGSLALEACIDINEPNKSVKKYINKNFGDIFEDAVIVSDYDDSFDASKITGNNYNTIFKKAKSELNSLINDNNNNENETSINESIIIKEVGKWDYGGEVFEEKNNQFINIINISKNESFGEVYMFLCKPSPLSLRVKSKKAELFLLRKYDASDISIRYPNIWAKFFKKSYINMLTIKSLTIQKIKYYWKNLGKQLTKEGKVSEDIFNLSNKSQKSKSNIVRSIIPKICVNGMDIKDNDNNDYNKIIDSDKNSTFKYSKFSENSSVNIDNKDSIKYISFAKDSSHRYNDRKYRSCLNENRINIEDDIKDEKNKRKNLKTYLNKNNIKLSRFKYDYKKDIKNDKEYNNFKNNKSIKKLRLDYLDKLNKKIKKLKISKKYYKDLWKELSYNVHKNSPKKNKFINNSLKIHKNNNINETNEKNEKKSYNSEKIGNINININFNNNNVILDKPEINISNISNHSNSSNSSSSSKSKGFINNDLSITSPINFTLMEKYENLEKLTKGEYSKNSNLRIITQKFMQFYISTFYNTIKKLKIKISEPNLSTICPLKNNNNYGKPSSNSLFSDIKNINTSKKRSSKFSLYKYSSIKTYTNLSEGKILIIYDIYKNNFYLYRNNINKKRFSASECKTNYKIGPQMKLNMNCYKNEFHNKSNYKNDFRNNKNVNKESFFNKIERRNNFLFHNNHKSKKIFDT